jgi:hypothetical protein
MYLRETYIIKENIMNNQNPNLINMSAKVALVSATVPIIESLMPYDEYLYVGVVEEMIDDDIEITESSLIEYYEDAFLCSQ